MALEAPAAVRVLDRRYLLDYPREAALVMEEIGPQETAAALQAAEGPELVGAWSHLTLEAQEQLLSALQPRQRRSVLTELEPARSAALLARLEPSQRADLLQELEPGVQRELRGMMEFDADSAGAIMDPRVQPWRGSLRAAEAQQRLRRNRPKQLHSLFLVDDDGRLEGRVELQDLLLAEPHQTLSSLARPVQAWVEATSPKEEVVEQLEHARAPELPVVDFNQRLLGVIRQSNLVTAVQEEASLDVQTMVGVSKQERALSKVGFAVTRRLPWLHINLLTAFLAAAVVGIFEDTIARFTALAVLLPVVAGQSGNAGAQALAVTMRGLALREIGLRHWPQVVWKEVNVGLFNGLAVAVTTAIGVYVWSRSLGLALIIAMAMVLSMVAAGFSGALIPIALTRFGQDPAQSSSIVLTTVTDVVGFFSFLGIATALAGLLESG